MDNHPKLVLMTANELENLILSKVRKALSEQANSPSKGRKFQAHDYLSILGTLVRILNFLDIHFTDIVIAIQSLFTNCLAEFFLKSNLDTWPINSQF